MHYKQRNYSKYAHLAIVCVMRYMNIQSSFSETEFFLRFILKRMQHKLFVYQRDLFVRCEKNFQGEIAINLVLHRVGNSTDFVLR